jgi:hypothetical protein
MEHPMKMKTGLFALLVGATLSTAAFAQYGNNPQDDKTGGGYATQGRSQSQGGGRYDPTTGGSYPADERAWRYERSRDRWNDDDRYRRYRDRDRYYDRDYDRYDRYDRW